MKDQKMFKTVNGKTKSKDNGYIWIKRFKKYLTIKYNV